MKAVTALASVSEEVKLIEYKKEVDKWNCITHAVGAALGTAGLVAAVIRASTPRAIISAIIYGVTFIAVYLVSAVYHGLPPGEKKRRARLIDHSTVPLLIAGTATPCALVTLHAISPLHGAFVFCLGWFCVIFGVFGKLFFFEKLKAAVIVVYITGGLIMLGSVLPLIGGSGGINTNAYALLIAGSVIYLIGGLFCRWGIKREAMHVVFHVFVVIASAVHYYVIYTYVLV